MCVWRERGGGGEGGRVGCFRFIRQNSNRENEPQKRMESTERIDPACVHHRLQISQHHNDESTLLCPVGWV